MTVEIAKLSGELSGRERLLDDAGHNVVNIHPSLVEFDLMTDSWTELVNPEITGRMASLQAQANFSDRNRHAGSVFPFRHFINVSQGRSAEAFFWRTAAKKDKKVVQNLLFPTTRHHVVMNRMTPVELPVPNVYGGQSNDLFRGNLDCGRLKALIAEEGAESIAYVYIEAENNASGGYPVSMANVREIRAIVEPHGIPMVLDATRLIENAALIQRFEAGHDGTPLREIVRDFCSNFDSMTCSLAKDFGLTRGGLIATNDEKLFFRAQDTVATFGPGVNAYDKAVINAALKGWDFIEHAVNRRVDQTARLHAAFVRQGLPLATPASGHCLLFDVADYLDLKQYRNPVTAFVARVFAHSGVRGGMHVTGMMKEFARPTLVRYAIPLCTPDAKIDALTEPFVAALKNLGRIPDLEKISNLPGITGQMHASYRPVAGVP